jgi:cation diffusion facilitator family transporter
MSNVRFQLFILIAGLIIAGLKAILYFETKSNAIFSDALESLVNISANTITLYSLYLSGKPRDKTHPYGHGKIEFLAAGIEGSLLFAAGFIAIIKSCFDFFHHTDIELSGLSLISVSLLGISNYVLGLLSEKKGMHSNSPALISSGKHLKGDGYTTLGLLISLLLIYFTGWNWLDIIIGILAGLFILYHGFKVMKSSILDIMGTADESILSRVVTDLQTNRRPTWIDIHNLRILKFGAEYHVDAHVTLPWYYSNKEVHNEMKAMHEVINNHFKSEVELFIHPDPCESFCCNYCEMKDCTERKQNFEKQIPWTLDNVLKDEKHAVYSINNLN